MARSLAPTEILEPLIGLIFVGFHSIACGKQGSISLLVVTPLALVKMFRKATNTRGWARMDPPTTLTHNEN